VNPLECILHMKVTVLQADLPPGDIVRVWMPAPLLGPTIQDIRVVTVRPEGTLRRLPDIEGEIGIAYLELPRLAEGNLELQLDIAFRSYATDFATDPKENGGYDTDADMYKRFTRSEQHIRVTPEVRALAQGIVGGESNPYLRARALYDWQVTHIPYSGIWTWRESIFSPFGSGSQEVMERRCGDCVIQSEFYAALCRSVGIPARVTGGFIFMPGFDNDHFWTEIYLSGLGWMPVDTTMSEGAQLAPDLTPAQKKALRDFFFGRLAPYRLPVHRSQVAQALVPEKRSPRRRAAFFTRPELECGGKDVEAIRFEWRCDSSSATGDRGGR
jgi:transglutaminase-like putative cysteine protease